jgi:ubiquinol-cytochrome c reductase cytochrome c subunit
MKSLLLFLGVAGALFAQEGNAENGKKLFSKFGCYECHGYQGQGGAAGAKLAPKPIAATALIAYVRHPSGTMPPYTAKVASDAALTDIRAYLASVPAPPPLKNIPLLNQ